MDDPFLYRSDIYAWARHQATVLRGLAGRRDLPNDFDLEHVAEEIEDVGNAQLSSVESYIRLIFVHLIKIVSVPDAPPVAHWKEEIGNFYIALTSRLTPSMTQLIDLQRVWERAIEQATLNLAAHDHINAWWVPADCPYSLEELLRQKPEVRRWLARIERPPQM